MMGRIALVSDGQGWGRGERHRCKIQRGEEGFECEAPSGVHVRVGSVRDHNAYKGVLIAVQNGFWRVISRKGSLPEWPETLI